MRKKIQEGCIKGWNSFKQGRRERPLSEREEALCNERLGERRKPKTTTVVMGRDTEVRVSMSCRRKPVGERSGPDGFCRAQAVC